MLDSYFYDTLSRLRIRMAHKTAGNLSGNRKSVKKGSSTEFSDFREYQPGDDIRRIDWNAYGRLDKLFIKEYMEEKEAVITILIDTSASMDYGARKKSELALQLAEALSYVGLCSMDRVQLYDTGRMQTPFFALGGKRSLPKLNAWLSQCSFTGKADLYEAVRMLPEKGSGVTIVISDFLEEELVAAALQENRQGRGEKPGDAEKAVRRKTDSEKPEKRAGGQTAVEKLLRVLDYRKQRVVLLQVLAEEEVDVTLNGTLNLIDMEREETLRVTLDDNVIRTYEKAVTDFTECLHKACDRVGGVYALCNTKTDLKQLIFQDLRMIYDL